MVIGQQITIPPIPHGSLIEKIIVGRLVNDLIAAGYRITVNDGEEDVVTESADPAVIFPALASTYSDTLTVCHTTTKGRTGQHPLTSWVLLIWGNDADIISDYGMTLDPLMQPIHDWTDTLEAR